MSERRAGELTIDELARDTGMTVRNIRAHQSRGLLPPPDVRARTGYYGPEHATRLRLIQDLQAEGFNLKAIERLISASNGAGEEVLAFGREVLTAFADEEPELDDARGAGDAARQRRPARDQEGREPRADPPARRRPLRGAEPDAAARGGGAGGDGRPADARARGRGADPAPHARDRRLVRAPLHGGRRRRRARPGEARRRRSGRSSATRSPACARSPARPSAPPSSRRCRPPSSGSCRRRCAAEPQAIGARVRPTGRRAAAD